MLPFLVEQYGPDADPRYLVTKINERDLAVDDPTFAAGVELECVERHAVRPGGRGPRRPRDRRPPRLPARPGPGVADVPRAGLRPAAGRALGRSRLPDPARPRRPRSGCPGGCSSRARRPPRSTPGSRAALKQAADPAAEAVRRAKKLLFAPELWASRPRARPRRRPGRPAAGRAVARDPDAGRAGGPGAEPRASATCGSGRSTSTTTTPSSTEVIRLLALLPQTGLIVDLRGNPGGLIWAAERMLQLFTDATDRRRPGSPSSRPPLTRQMAASPFNRLELEALEPVAGRRGLHRRAVRPAAAAHRPRLVQRPRPALPRPGGRGRRRQHLLLRRPVRRRLGRPRHRPAGQRRPGDRRRRGQRVDLATSCATRWPAPTTSSPPLPGGAGFTLAIRRAIRSARSRRRSRSRTSASPASRTR